MQIFTLLKMHKTDSGVAMGHNSLIIITSPHFPNTKQGDVPILTHRHQQVLINCSR